MGWLWLAWEIQVSLWVFLWQVLKKQQMNIKKRSLFSPHFIQDAKAAHLKLWYIGSLQASAVPISLFIIIRSFKPRVITLYG